MRLNRGLRGVVNSLWEISLKVIRSGQAPVQILLLDSSVTRRMWMAVYKSIPSVAQILFSSPICRNDLQQQRCPFQPHRLSQRIVVSALPTPGDKYSTRFSPPEYVRPTGSRERGQGQYHQRILFIQLNDIVPLVAESSFKNSIFIYTAGPTAVGLPNNRKSCTKTHCRSE